MTERRTIEQQRLDGGLWAANLRRGLTVAQVAIKEDISEAQVYRDLRTGGFSLKGLHAEAEAAAPPRLQAPTGTIDRPPWTRLSNYEIAFLHRVRDEIRAADRARAARGIFMD